MIAKIEEKFVETKGSKYLYGLLLVSIVFGYASYKCFIEIYDFFIPHLIVRYMEPSWLTVLFSFVFSLATFFSILGIAKSKYSKQKYGKIVYRKLFFAISPLLFLIVVFFITPSLAIQIIYTVVVTLSLYRLLLLFPSERVPFAGIVLGTRSTLKLSLSRIPWGILK